MNDATFRAQQLLGGNIDWQDDVTGFLECPGKDLHNTPDGKKDCRIKLDGAPTIFCVHQSCRGVIETLNRALRRELASGLRRPSYRSYQQPRGPTREQRLAEQAAKSLATILEKFSAPLGDSSTKLTGNVHGDAVLFLDLFQPGDVVWIGNKTDSAADTSKDENDIKRCRLHFQSVERWKRRLTGAWQSDFQLICPNVFKPGSHSRCNESLTALRFLIVESDVLSKSEVMAVFQWLRQTLTLRAVIDTAGKSLHGWFDYPSAGNLAELKAVLPAMKCDKQLFVPSQPVRRPGGLRDEGHGKGRYQELLWLNLERNP